MDVASGPLMRNALKIVCFFWLFAVFMGQGQPVAAQSLMGVVDSIGESVSPDSPLRVSSAAFNDLNMRLEPVVIRALKDKGFIIVDDAPVVLSFSAATATAATRPGESPLDLRTSTPDAVATADPESEIRRRNPFLKAEPRQAGTGGRSSAGQRPYSLSFIVARAGNAPIWQGSVSARMYERDPFKATSRLVPTLVDQVGRTMRGHSVEIP